MFLFHPFLSKKLIVELLNGLHKQSQHLEEIYQQKLAALAELKQSLLQKAFNGELTAEPETAIKQEALA